MNTNWTALGAAKAKAMRKQYRANFVPKLIVEMWDGTPYVYFEDDPEHHFSAEQERLDRDSKRIDGDLLRDDCDLTTVHDQDENWHMVIDFGKPQ